MKVTRKHIGSILITGFITVLIALFFLYSLHLVYYPICDLLRGEISFSEFTEEIHTRYSEHLALKTRLISLNGGFSAALDQSTCNDVVKLRNGKLSKLDDSFDDQTENAREIIEFSDFLNSLDTPFLFVQLPLEIDLKETVLPYNYEDARNDEADQLLRLLANASIPVLDLRASLSATPDLIVENYFLTDHHWNFTGAFSAFQMIVRRIQECFPEQKFDTSWTDPEQWESHTLEKWFLGTRGKRVGPYYGGVDDLVYFTPRDSSMTNISCAIPSEGMLRKGNFSDAVIFPKNINPRNYYSSNPYVLYFNDNYPLFQLRNPDAPNHLRVLLIRNSFALPVMAFSSMLFQEIDVIDPRAYSDSIPRYVQLTHPDVVIDMIPSTQFLVDTALKSADARDSILAGEDIEVQKGKPASLAVALDCQETYTFGFDDIEFTEGESQAATVELYDNSADAPIGSAIFDVAYCRKNGGFSSFLSIPEGAGSDIELRFYAGAPGDESENCAIFRGFHLEKVE